MSRRDRQRLVASIEDRRKLAMVGFLRDHEDA
jgi:hypothetical protein